MKPGLLDTFKQRAHQLQRETLALSLAYRDRRTPWFAKIFAALVVAYAFSPIDLIPDFIPLLGYLDDLLIVPAGIYLALKMIPAEVLEDSRQKAEAHLEQKKPIRWVGAVLILAVWLLILYLAIQLAWNLLE